jgi:Tfp pilus assembly protein PilO
MNAMLQDTDNQLAAMPPAQRAFVIAFVAIAVMVAGWYFVGDDMLAQIENEEGQIASLQAKIRRNTVRALGARIAKKKKAILKLESAIERAKVAETALRARTERLDFFFFDRERFYEMFERILRRSTELGVRLDSVTLEDEVKAVSPLLEQKKRIRFEGAGLFGPVVRLSWFIESFNALVKIDRFAIWYDEEAKEERFAIDLLLYGAVE